MTRRTERIGSVIRETIGQVLLTKLSDPRIDPARTSVTRVKVPEDLLSATVYVSVIGTEAEGRRTLRGLRHAAGRIQELMRQRISLRHTPVLEFELDSNYKKTLQTLEIIDRAMAEIRRKDAPDPGAGEGAPAPPAPPPEHDPGGELPQAPPPPGEEHE